MVYLGRKRGFVRQACMDLVVVIILMGPLDSGDSILLGKTPLLIMNTYTTV